MHLEDMHADTHTSVSVMGKRLTDETGNNAKASVLVGNIERKVKLKEKKIMIKAKRYEEVWGLGKRWDTRQEGSRSRGSFRVFEPG